MISCTEATKRLWEYLDATLDSADHARVEEHLSHCRRCCGELEFAEELRRFLASAERDEVPPEVLERLHDTLRELGP